MIFYAKKQGLYTVIYKNYGFGKIWVNHKKLTINNDRRTDFNIKSSKNALE